MLNPLLAELIGALKPRIHQSQFDCVYYFILFNSLHQITGLCASNIDVENISTVSLRSEGMADTKYL